MRYGRMDLISANQSSADVSPLQLKQNAAVAPKRDRRLTLTKIDKRGRLGKRVAELTAMFTAAVGGEADAHAQAEGR